MFQKKRLSFSARWLARRSKGYVPARSPRPVSCGFMAPSRRDGRSLRIRLVERHGHRGRGREIVVAMQLADRAAERAAHRKPHDLLDALGAAEAHVLGMGHAREALGVA